MSDFVCNSFSPRNRQKRWWAVQVYVQQLAALLLQANGDALSPAGLQTTAVMQQASLMFCSKMRLNPVSMRKCALSFRGPASEHPTEGLSRASWIGIADAMGLSKEQRQSLCQIRRLYLLRQGQLIRTRKQIITQIQVLIVPLAPPACSSCCKPAVIGALQCCGTLADRVDSCLRRRALVGAMTGPAVRP